MAKKKKERNTGHRMYKRAETRDYWGQPQVGWFYHCACKGWETHNVKTWMSEFESDRYAHRDHRRHRLYEEADEAPMQYIGTAHLKTVDHEIWIGHSNGQLPEFYDRPERDGWGRRTGRYVKYAVYGPGWHVIQKNSKGWRPWAGGYIFDVAIAQILGFQSLNTYEANGYEVEYADNVNISTITRPQLPFDKYLISLVEQSKEVSSIEEVKALQDHMDKVIALNDAVVSARKEMLERALTIV